MSRGFALLSKEAIKEISSKGGKAAHACGRAHRYTSEEARLNGAKGGRIAAERKAAKKAALNGSAS